IGRVSSECQRRQLLAFGSRIKLLSSIARQWPLVPADDSHDVPGIVYQDVPRCGGYASSCPVLTSHVLLRIHLRRSPRQSLPWAGEGGALRKPHLGSGCWRRCFWVAAVYPISHSPGLRAFIVNNVLGPHSSSCCFAYPSSPRHYLPNSSCPILSGNF